MFHLDSNLLAKENFTSRNSVFTALAFGLFMYLPGYAVSQNMIQRYVCAGSLSAGRGVVILSAVINAGLGLLFLLVGVALFAFYVQAGGAGLPAAGSEIASQDQIMPYFVANELPGMGLVGLILAGLFAAAMSTIDSGINGVTSVIIYDWFAGRQLRVRTSRILTAGLGLLVIGAAILAPVFGDTVIGMINTIAGTCLGMLLAIYLLGLFSSRANLPGVLIGFVWGLITLVLVWALTNVPKWWFGAFAMFPVIIVGLVASRFFPAPDKAVLERTLLRHILRQKEC
jgi:Na+/proline symporter